MTEDKIILEVDLKVSVKLDLFELVKSYTVDENELADAIESRDFDKVQEIINGIPHDIGSMFVNQVDFDLECIEPDSEIRVKAGDRTLIG